MGAGEVGEETVLVFVAGCMVRIRFRMVFTGLLPWVVVDSLYAGWAGKIVSGFERTLRSS